MEELFGKINSKYRVRYYSGQKRKFRTFITEEFNRIGYNDIEIDKAKNIIVGDCEKAEIVYSAHYDTPMFAPFTTPLCKLFGDKWGMIVCAVLIMSVLVALSFALWLLIPVLELSHGFFVASAVAFSIYIFPNPNNANDNTSGILAIYNIAKKLKTENQNIKVAFILFNCEEIGLLGSKSFVKNHEKHYNQKPQFTLCNLDCVGVGTDIVIEYNSEKAKVLANSCREQENARTIHIQKSNFFSKSDHTSFTESVLICVESKSVCGPLYIPRIHMPYDIK